MGMILRIASSRIVGQGDIVGRSGYFSLNLSANSVMRGRLDARRTLKSLVADLRLNIACKAQSRRYTLRILYEILFKQMKQFDFYKYNYCSNAQNNKKGSFKLFLFTRSYLHELII
jgi:hypothetical protein